MAKNSKRTQVVCKLLKRYDITCLYNYLTSLHDTAKCRKLPEQRQFLWKQDNEPTFDQIEIANLTHWFVLLGCRLNSRAVCAASFSADHKKKLIRRIRN